MRWRRRHRETCHHCHQTIECCDLVVAEDHHGDEQALHAACYAMVTDPAYWEFLRDEKVDRRRNERLGL